jgi:hypothetical protein
MAARSASTAALSLRPRVVPVTYSEARQIEGGASHIFRSDFGSGARGEQDEGDQSKYDANGRVGGLRDLACGRGFFDGLWGTRAAWHGRGCCHSEWWGQWCGWYGDGRGRGRIFRPRSRCQSRWGCQSRWWRSQRRKCRGGRGWGRILGRRRQQHRRDGGCHRWRYISGWRRWRRSGWGRNRW